MEIEEIKEAFPTFEGDWEHLWFLLQGPEHWQKWRTENPDVEPDLKALDLSPRDERPPGKIWVQSDLQLREALDRGDQHRRDTLLLTGESRRRIVKTWEAHLIFVQLSGANLERAVLQDVVLKEAFLVKAHLEFHPFGACRA